MNQVKAIVMLKLIKIELGDIPLLAEAVDFAINFLQEMTWIPVWLWLPLCEEKVLVQTREGLITDGRYTGETWFTTDDYTCYKVVAWMPVPKPWNGEV